jgi:hypothetical protein
MKKHKLLKKFFNNNEEYFNFIKKDNIKIYSVEFTHNFKIKVTYAIIK